MNYFDQNVLDELADENILLSTSEQAAYIQICEEVKKGKKPIKTKKAKGLLRRYSLWHIPTKNRNFPISHWLVLPGKSNWDTKTDNVVTKLAINIQTGEKQFLKIRRPVGEFYENDHVKESMNEAYNHARLGSPSFHCQRNTFYGFKAYLFQTYCGQINLLDMLERSKTTSREILGLIIAAGEALAEIHRAGFIHCDFKLQNVVYNKFDQTVSIIDLEDMLSTTQGEAGVKGLRGTRSYCHPSWLFDSACRIADGKRVKFSIKNDIYAFLACAYIALEEAGLRKETPEYLQRIRQAREQLKNWQSQALDKIPSLDTVLVFLHQLEKEPELDLAQQMENVSLNKNKNRL